MALLAEARTAGARLGPAAELLGLTARTVQRWRQRGAGDDERHGPHHAPANRLSECEREHLLAVVNLPAYRELSPWQIVPRLLDQEGCYLASEATIYRVLRQQGQLTHRERSRPAHLTRPRPQVATAPNQVWSWDITWLRGPVRGTFYYLYLFTDVWSRKIVAAEVHPEESAGLAAAVFQRACRRLDLDPAGLALHSDNGSPMKGETMLATLQRLGVVPSFSRPRVSDDNPYSEALFRTMKYRPQYPELPFDSLAAAQAWVDRFVQWYNTEHRHSAIRYVTPEQRHRGQDTELLARRHQHYQRARAQHPERWSGRTRNWTPINTVILNPARKAAETQVA
jgi:transposase InsO family protein